MKSYIRKIPASVIFLLLPLLIAAQETGLEAMISDTSLMHGTVSFCAIDAASGEILSEYCSNKSLPPASILKLVTSAAALELLGPSYRFRTSVGYTGSLNSRTGRLTGDIIIKGGGDPAFASSRFPDNYGNIASEWTRKIAEAGIKKVEGRVITDDSWYDYQPVPAKWLWEDAGNYYGAGAYGLSVFDNTYEIFLKKSAAGSSLEIADIVPPECRSEFSNWLVAAGTADEGYVFAAPYSTNGWLAGTVPENLDGFSLKASVSDPPRLFAKIMNDALATAGISVAGAPSTSRLDLSGPVENLVPVSDTWSPPLSEIIEALNHESVNLYAEHFVKELGRKFRNSGSTAAGIEVINEFLKAASIDTGGMFIEDGSGLSPLNSVNAREMTKLLVYMRNNGKYFGDFYGSLPEAGIEGTVKNYFKDPVFRSRLRLKSGSITRVRSYCGYLDTMTGRPVAFTIIVQNYTGSSRHVVSLIENLLSDIILHK